MTHITCAYCKKPYDHIAISIERSGLPICEDCLFRQIKNNISGNSKDISTRAKFANHKFTGYDIRWDNEGAFDLWKTRHPGDDKWCAECGDEIEPDEQSIRLERNDEMYFWFHMNCMVDFISRLAILICDIGQNNPRLQLISSLIERGDESLL